MSKERDEAIKRRTERKRRIRRRRMFIAFLFFIIISLVVGVVLCLTVLFKAENITASGSKLYTADEIVKASGITADDNILLVNEEEVTQIIRSKLPFVDDVNLSRKLPDTLLIEATDAKEYLTVAFDGVYYTVSKRGYVLAAYNERPEGLFEIRCKTEKPVLGDALLLTDGTEAENLKAIAENLTAGGIVIDYIDVTNSLELEAKVEGRFIVNFGTYSNLDKKIAHLSGMISGIEKDKTGKINLSMWTSDKTEGSFVEGSINE